jgi:hypothetical protein
MRRPSIPSYVLSLLAGGLVVGMSLVPACGGSGSDKFTNGGSSGGASSSSGSGIPNLGGGSGGGGGGDGGSSGLFPPATCPSTMQCNVACNGGGSTTITGTVMDPAGKDPLYDIVVYVPSTALGTLPSGVPTGAAACSCSALFQGNPLVYTTTDTSGNFTITNAPVGTNIPLVAQVGKWRKQITVNTTACNATSAGSINLPKNGTEGDIPDIAVSTGGADSLECLLRRIGLDAAEYVPGWTTPGHVHIYNGGDMGGGGGGGGSVGGPEQNLMTGAPNSSDKGGLWDSQADLMKNDIVLLSCEGGETYNAVPANLESYLNAGGRVFASHYHYAWFNGSKGNYTAPTDWGSNLAAWTPGSAGGSNTVGGEIDTTLTGGGSFPKGVALQQWMTNLGALTTSPGGTTVASPEVAVVVPRYNAKVTTQKPSQPWINLDTSTDATGAKSPTLYFSFDTPVNAAQSDYCGRAVFSGLHVGGASYDGVNCGGGGGGGGGGGDCNTGAVAAAPPPAGCDTGHPLSPQEKVLEFMLFDLSSCVVPDNVAPSGDGGVPYIPK